MRNSKFKIQNLRILFCILHFAFCIFTVNAQSTDQNFPTAVTTNQINGTIKARDLGDSRLTTYFYLFGGEQGDIFINAVTKNFDGDIDVFTVNGLKPLTKIRVFSDSSDNETGRIIYLRQPEKMILRVEGRSPNDDPATFQIKFAGSFVAEKNSAKENETPQVKAQNQSEVRVNSVGTIIETKPKENPAKTEKTETVAEKQEEKPKPEEKINEKQEETSKAEEKVQTEKTEEKPPVEVVITDNLEQPKEEKNQEKVETKTEEKIEEKAEEKSESAANKEVNPLENIRLTVIFKDGKKIERPMSEVLNVNVDKGILTIIQKDGTIGRYSILDIVEFTIK